MENKVINKIVPGSGDLVIRTGDAEDIIKPRKIDIRGDVNAVTQYLSLRLPDNHRASTLQDIDPAKAIVIVSVEKGTITFESDPNHPLGTTITSSLTTNPDLQKFCINTETKYSKDSLVRLLKHARRFFPNVDQYESLVEKLMRLNLDMHLGIKTESDFRGNKDVAVRKSVRTDVPEYFILSMPLFKGAPPTTFKVDICLDVTDGSVQFWLESAEMTDLGEVYKHNAMAERVKEIEQLVRCPIIFV